MSTPTVADPVRQRGRGALAALFALTGVGGVLGAAAIAATAGDPPGAGLAVLLALGPLPLLWFAYWWLDRYEPEPWRYKLAAFVWGGVVAVALALVVEGLASSVGHLGQQQVASFVAPLSEEPAKGLFLLLTFVRARRVIDGYLDGLIYAGLVGIGFAFMENVGYYAAGYLGTPDMKIAGAQAATYTFVVRGIFSPLAHPMFTSVLGIAVGFAIAHHRRSVRVLIIAAGLAGSISLHMLWNASLSYGGGSEFLLVYLALGVALLVVAVVAVVVRVQQVRVLERSLRAVADRGWIHPDEVRQLARFATRRTALRTAREAGGSGAAKAVKQYQRLATEVAFLHDSVARDRYKPGAAERRNTLLEAMYALRTRLTSSHGSQ